MGNINFCDRGRNRRYEAFYLFNATEEIIQIVMNNDGTTMRNLLSDFLKRFEEGLIDSNKDDILNCEVPIEPPFDRNDLD